MRGAGAVLGDHLEGRAGLARPQVAPAPAFALPALPALDLRAAPQVVRSLAQPLSLSTPALTMSFPGLVNGTPPDPVIAAGPESLVVIANGGIALLTKTGALIDQSFPDGFDPK